MVGLMISLFLSAEQLTCVLHRVSAKLVTCKLGLNGELTEFRYPALPEQVFLDILSCDGPSSRSFLSQGSLQTCPNCYPARLL